MLKIHDKIITFSLAFESYSMIFCYFKGENMQVSNIYSSAHAKKAEHKLQQVPLQI